MQQTRHARRLYVGNLPLGAPEMDVLNFFNGVLNALLPPGYLSRGDQPVLNVKLMPDKQFGFIEFSTMEVAAAATNLDCVMFNSRPDLPASQLKLKRPNDFKAELVPVTMQIPPLNLQILAQLTGGGGGNREISHMQQHQVYSQGPNTSNGGLQRNVADGPNKIFVGGLPYHLSEGDVMDILQAFGPLKSFNLVREPGSVTSKGYAFCEYMNPETTHIVVRDLHGLAILDKQLTVKSSSSESGGGGGGGGGLPPPAYAAAYQPAPVPGLIAPSHQQIQHNSKILKLSNMVTRDDVQDDAEHLDIRDDVSTECATFGKVFQVIIPRVKDGFPAATEGTIFVEFETPYGAAQAKLALTGRKFADNIVVVEYASKKKPSVVMSPEEIAAAPRPYTGTSAGYAKFRSKLVKVWEQLSIDVRGVLCEPLYKYQDLVRIPRQMKYSLLRGYGDADAINEFLRTFVSSEAIRCKEKSAAAYKKAASVFL